MTEEGFDLGPVPQRLTVTTEQVAALVREQFPQWADRAISPVSQGGWDNFTFHLGDDLIVRLPSAAEYAEAVAKEQRWLPVLAAQLPLPIPAQVGVGRPGAGYPYPWSVQAWIDGTVGTPEAIESSVGLATDLAGFLAALQRVDPTGGPGPGVHNWFRGGTLRTFAPDVERSLDELRGVLDVDAARAVWDDALAARWDGIPRWFHGDVAAGNLLLNDRGRLSAVIDFGTCGVGDPSCDLAAAWTLLDDDGRAACRSALSVDDGTWRRGRGWALWKALATCRNTHDDQADRVEFERARGVVEALVGSDR